MGEAARLDRSERFEAELARPPCLTASRAVVGSIAALAVALVLAGCGGAGNDVVADTRQSTVSPLAQEPDESTTSAPVMPSETWSTSSTAPAPPRPTSCGTTEAPDETVVSVVISSGWGECRDATALIDIYYADLPSPTEDPTQRRVIDGWECAIDTSPTPGPITRCALPGQAVVTASP